MNKELTDMFFNFNFFCSAFLLKYVNFLVRLHGYSYTDLVVVYGIEHLLLSLGVLGVAKIK